MLAGGPNPNSKKCIAQLAGNWARVGQVLCDMPPVDAFMPSNVLALARSLIGPQSNLPDSCRSAPKIPVHQD